ncbi:TetR family transcriptional regulator [Rhodococcus opacus RKJ300 = JCM 13270]|uniref:TetR family transcriptional regulator n=1 Tax=Rhodococcus opacus RKJ300 = JCM 13270 TaxID=1165867 RepID=I0WMY9_RHOOP|nr:TetR family transcriptional regulator [Rhodococcus opacus RKJ300 = JCM 13270]
MCRAKDPSFRASAPVRSACWPDQKPVRAEGHAARRIRGLWPIESTPHHQLLTYEIISHALRRLSVGNLPAGAITEQQYRLMDAETVTFLTLCASSAGVTWITPVGQVARPRWRA